MQLPWIILADWDEEIGPIIVKALYPEEVDNPNENNPEVIVSRSYISAQSIFAKEQFSKIRFNLPMVSIKKLAVVLFDIISDPSVRGQQRPFILIVFTPLTTPYAVTDVIVEVAEPFIHNYKNGRVPDLGLLQEYVQEILEKGPEAVRSGMSKAELKKEFSKMLQDQLFKLSTQGVSLRVYVCPECGAKIYPDEVGCTKCRYIIRTFCSRCNNLVEKTRQFCPKCGQRNDRHEPELKLKSKDEINELEFLTELEIASATSSSKHDEIKEILKLEIDDEFDQSSENLHDEISELKKELQGNDKSVQREKLFETFTRDFSGFRKGDKDILGQSFDATLGESAVDEIDLLIKSMSITPQSDEIKAPVIKEALINTWDCEAILHAQGQVLIGLGTNPELAKGIQGTVFITESMFIFIGHVQEMEGGKITNIFAYFDASIQHIDKHIFRPGLHENKITFMPHGFFKKKYGNISSIHFNFSWSEDPEKDKWEYQAFILQSTLDKLKVFERPIAIPCGKHYFITGKPPNDPSIRTVLADFKLNHPVIIKLLQKKYPILF